MLNCFNRARTLAQAMGIALFLTGVPTQAQDTPPDAKLQLSTHSAGFLVGYTEGTGTLDFKGQHLPFMVKGITLATIGAGKTTAIGQVYRLREAADLEGHYVVLDGGLTIGKGGGSTVLSNPKGVMIYLQNVQQGFSLTLGGGDLDIAFTTAERTPPIASTAPIPSENTPTLNPPVWDHDRPLDGER